MEIFIKTNKKHKKIANYVEYPFTNEEDLKVFLEKFKKAMLLISNLMFENEKVSFYQDNDGMTTQIKVNELNVIVFIIP